VNPTGPGAVLRPLGIGEILDRAVTLCVRNFMTLGLIYVIFVIPLSVIQYYGSKDTTAFLQAMTDAVKSGNANDSSEILRKIGANNTGFNPWTSLLLLVSFFISPLPIAALTAAVAAMYLKRPTSFAIAYRVGLSRWGNLLGVILMYLFAGGFLYTVAIIGIIAVALAVGVLYSAAATAGIIVGVIAAVIAVLIAIVALTLVALAYQMSCLACIIERLNFVMAFMSGLRRVFAGIGMRRALPFGLAYVAIFVGVDFVQLAGAVLLTGVLHSAAAGVAYGALITVITAAFSTAFIVIFYYDLRVREEGLDLQMLAENAQSQPLPSP
jgi:hypothetical protein